MLHYTRIPTRALKVEAKIGESGQSHRLQLPLRHSHQLLALAIPETTAHPHRARMNVAAVPHPSRPKPQWPTTKTVNSRPTISRTILRTTTWCSQSDRFCTKPLNGEHNPTYGRPFHLNFTRHTNDMFGTTRSKKFCQVILQQ